MNSEHNIIRIFVEPQSQKDLFQYKIGNYLKSVFKTLTGKNMSCDILRHIYITDFRRGEKSTEKKLMVAKKMMNSVETQTEYMRVE